MIKGAIFDLDGTLLDSMYLWEFIASDYVRSLGIEPKAGLDEESAYMTMQQFTNHLITEYAIDKPEQEVADEINKMIEWHYDTDIELKPGVRAFLHKMHDQKVAMCIITASESYIAKAALKRLGVLDYFIDITSCSDFGAGKGHPEIFMASLSKIGTEISETAVFEDALYALKTAKEIGFTTIGIYDKTSASAEQEMRAIADAYITDFTEAEKLEL
jgi:HAD superfamily hydrolase (TIGR01509 family)